MDYFGKKNYDEDLEDEDNEQTQDNLKKVDN